MANAVVPMSAKDAKVLVQYARDANMPTDFDDLVKCNTWVVDETGEIFEAIDGEPIHGEGFCVSGDQPSTVLMLSTTGFPWGALDYDQSED